VILLAENQLFSTSCEYKPTAAPPSAVNKKKYYMNFECYLKEAPDFSQIVMELSLGTLSVHRKSQ